MKKVLKHFPELEGDELRYIANAVEDLEDEQLELFKSIYKARRKDPILLLFMALIGLFGVAGLHRFFVGHIGMGILYFLTLGLCFVGTIVDMINYKNFAFEYNRNVALEILNEIE